jgi:OOP family OmpA-OmpF porin
MSDDREKLKALLLSEEMAQIEALQKLLNDKQQFSEKISEVLDSATDLAITKNPTFQKKFAKIDPKTYVRAIKANKQTFIDALLPIIGPMIRQSVTSAIRRFVADVNRAVELGVSAKAMKWRWTAFRTGVPFTEIVFNNTIEYQVQQVFLIDNHTGLLIEYAGHEHALMQDKDAMSAMLTAIQDFVKDSVSNAGEGLTAAELGDNLVWLVQGNQANMAVVIKGAPTQRLHDTIVTATENIHIEFHHELEDPTLWNSSPELKVELEKLLLTKTQSDEQEEKKSLNFWPWLLIFTGLFCWWAWSHYQHQQLRQKITTELNQTPGFVLSDLNYRDGRFIATGLQDPLTDFKQLDDRVSIESMPFISLHDDIISRRISALLNDSNLLATVKNQSVTLTGVTNKSSELQQKIDFLTLLPGVKQVTDLSTQEITETWQTYIQKNPPPKGVQVEQKDQVIHLTGATTETRLKDFINAIQNFAVVDSSAVEIYSFDQLAEFINNNPLTMSNPYVLNLQQKQHLDVIYLSYIRLLNINNSLLLKLSSRSDCQGSVIESNQYNQSRLSMAVNYLTDKGLSEQSIMTETIECTATSSEIDPAKIGIWFEVLP